MLRSRWNLAVPLLLLSVAGCDGPLTVSQRLVGEWLGRPESAAERTLREWPGRRGEDGDVDPEDPEIVAAIENAPPTDLEEVSQVTVQMRLKEAGDAALSLDGQQPLVGNWSVTTVEGRRAQLEIAIDGADEPVRRRFAIEFLRTGDAFVLHEVGADPRFGRLLFTRAGAKQSGSAPASSPAE